MNSLNYIVLVVGLILISVLWNAISSKDRKKEIMIVTVSLSILSVVVYFLQSTLWPIA